MSQFRNTADVLDEILQKSGEPTNGNSLFETLARTYANKVHHAIVAGGNIFNIEVDEPWVWARSRFPITLELQPAFTSGSVSCTVNDINITFTTAPSYSVEGWHFQVNGRGTVYKITQHTAGGISAVIDSSFVDDTGAYSFRAFQLDYEIVQAYVYIDNYNDRIDFQEGTAFTTRTASLTHGSYTLSGLITHAVTKMAGASTASISGGYDSVLKQYNVTCSSSLKILGSTGNNAKRSALPLLGFDQVDYTGAQSYTSSYTPNAIARLIEPFKLFTSERNRPFIYSTDPIKMQEDYPIALTRERIPDRFNRLTEDSSGTIWVRFNSYPKYKTKVQLDWIRQPIDLQDNTVSMVKLPRADVDTLIHGAAAFIAFDKSDARMQMFLDMTKAGLQAMKKKNHTALMRTGQNFGQIVPRADYDNSIQRLNYGYTSGTNAAAGSTASTTNVLVAVTIPYASFQTANTINTVVARTLPANRSLLSIIAKHASQFTGAGISALALDVGTTSDATYFINGFDPTQVVSGTAQASWVGLFYPAESSDIKVRMTSTGANLSALVQGSLVIYLQENLIP